MAIKGISMELLVLASISGVLIALGFAGAR
jgi:hypothetical protein